MYKIAVMGDQDSVLGFKALGLEVCAAATAEQAREALHRMAKEDYAIIYMTGKEGSLGIGMDNVKTAVERAVGADIL